MKQRLTGVKVHVDDLVCAYGNRAALESVGLEIEKGGFVAIIGPNGSGKTTLLKAVSRVITPRRGQVLIENNNVLAMSRKQLARQIAVVPQETNLNFNFSVYDVVLMGRTPHIKRWRGEGPEDRQVARWAMRATNTLELAERSILQLSGGERQRVIIAQALAQEPQVMLLDEPTLHLDLNHQLEIMELLKQLNERGLTVVSVLHDLNLASYYAKTLVLLKSGKVECIGSPDQVLTPDNIRRTFGMSVLVKRHALTGKPYLSILPGKRVSRAKTSFNVHVVGGDGRGAPIMSALLAKGFNVSAGVINALDTDEEAARLLGVPAVVEAPFTSISDESFMSNIEKMKRSDMVVVADIPFGPGNLRNLEAAVLAAEAGVKVALLGGRDIADKDFSGGVAAKLLSRLEALNCLKAGETSELLETLEHLAGEPIGK